MSVRDTVTVPVQLILDLVSAAYSCGTGSSMFYDGMAEMLGFELSNEEIDAHVDWYSTDEAAAHGYEEDDEDEALQALTEWRDKYCTAERREQWKAEK